MFKGLISALVTPFTPDGKLDRKNFINLLSDLDPFCDFHVACGTTGECATLNDEEKIEIFKLCVKNSKRKIIANCGTNSTLQSLFLANEAKKCGAAALLIIVPYYNRPTMVGCFEHFKALSSVGLPWILYHHPKRTGIELPLDFYQKIEKLPNIVGIKEASGNREYITRLAKATSIPIFAGDDALTPFVMRLGGVGVISGSANVIPFEMSTMVRLCQEEKFVEAEQYLQEKKALLDALFMETNPQGVKFALSLMNKCSSFLRLPLVEPQEATKEKIREALLSCGFSLPMIASC